MSIIESIDTVKWFLETFAALVIAIAPLVIVFQQKGNIDLAKTIGAASDVAEILRVQLRKPNAPDPEALLREGLEHIEELRGKKLSPKLKRKATAHITAKLYGDRVLG